MRRFLLPSLLIVLVLAAFHRVPTFDFVNLDDNAHVDKHPGLRDFDLATIWGGMHKGMYIPMTYTVLSLEAQFAKGSSKIWPPNPHVKDLDPLPFHVGNLLLHTTNTVLLFYFLLGFGFLPLMCFLAAALYGVHPIQVEMVSWISAHKDTVSNLFVLLSLLYFQRKIINASAKFNFKAALILSLLVFLALVSKPSTVFIAPFLMLWWWWQRPKERAVGAKILALPFFLSVGFAIETSSQQPSESLPFTTHIFERIWVALDTLTFYGWKLIWPSQLVVDYGRNPPALFAMPERWWTWLPAAAVLFFIYRNWKKIVGPARLGLVLTGLAIFPVLGLKPFVYQTISTVSDRYLAAPLMGVALWVAWALTLIINSRWQKAIFAASGALLIVWCVASFQLSQHWSSIDSLWTRVTTVNPNSWLGFNNWAAHYEVKQERKKAIELYERSVAIRPDSEVFTRIGILYYDVGDYPQAVQRFARALELNPNNAIARQNYQLLTGR